MEHLTDRQVIALRAGSAPAEEAFALLEHSASCTVCSERVMSRNEMALQMASLSEILRGSVAHLSLDEMIDLVDGSLPPQEKARMNAHLAECPSCSAHVLTMREEAPSGAVAQPAHPRFTDWIAAFFTLPRMGVVTAVLLVATLSGWFLLRHHAAEPEIATRPTPTASTSGMGEAPQNTESPTGGQENTETMPAGEAGPVQGRRGATERGSLLAIALMPGIVRGESSEKAVHLPSQTETLLLTLNSREELTPGRYRVALTNSAGRRVWQHEAVYSNSPDAVAVRVPAKLLSAGRYVVDLSVVESDLKSEHLEEYALRMVK